MTAPSSFKQSDVRRVLAAAAKAGFTPTSCTIAPSGEIAVKFAEQDAAALNSFDSLIGKPDA